MEHRITLDDMEIKQAILVTLKATNRLNGDLKDIHIGPVMDEHGCRGVYAEITTESDDNILVPKQDLCRSGLELK